MKSVNKNSEFPILLLLSICWTLSLIDIAITYFVINSGVGRENNPLLKWLIINYGFAAAMIIKIIATIVMLLLFYVFSVKYKEHVRYVNLGVIIVSVLYVWIVFFNTLVFTGMKIILSPFLFIGLVACGVFFAWFIVLKNFDKNFNK